MEEITFKAGNVVQLRSGGPLMTVTGVADDVIWTKWFEGYRVMAGGFRKEILQIAPQNPNAYGG